MKEFQDGISQEFLPIKNSIILTDRLIFLTEVLNKISLKSRVQVTSFNPIPTEQRDACIALSQEEISLLKESTNKSNSKTRLLSPKRGNRPKSNALISKNRFNFSDNFYRIELKGNYIRVINFINYLQEYDILIVANCFRSEGIINSTSANNQQKNKGEVIAEFIFNIPSR